MLYGCVVIGDATEEERRSCVCCLAQSCKKINTVIYRDTGRMLKNTNRRSFAQERSCVCCLDVVWFRVFASATLGCWCAPVPGFNTDGHTGDWEKSIAARVQGPYSQRILGLKVAPNWRI